MLPGEYLVRSLDHPDRTTVVELGRGRHSRLRQGLIVAFVARHWREIGYAPTLREIAHGCGLRDCTGAAYQVGLLIAQGRLAQEAGIPRSIRVVEQ